MTIDRAVSRRGILTAGAGAAGVAVLAACSGGSSGDSAGGSATAGDGSGADVITPPSTSVAASSGAAPTAEDGGTAAAPGSAASLVALDDLSVGGSKSVTLADGKPAIVTRTGATTAVCFSAICTHQGCTVKPKGNQFDCPCHGSSYNARTGAVLGGPAPSPLPKIAVTVTDGEVTEAG